MSCKILTDDIQVMPALTSMRMPRAIMRDILDRVVAERGQVNENDPRTAYGYETWRWATRYLREQQELRELEWVTCRHNQIEGIRNDVAKIKLVVMNTDSYTGMPSKVPHNVAGKGPSILRHVKSNYGQLPFAFFESNEDHPIEKYDFFVFCIHAGERHVSAEISRPIELTGSTITNYSTRIMLCQPGEFDGFRLRDPVPEDFAEVELPKIERKKG